ncbi:MAG: hypothetical protein ABR534_04220 [Desulfotignum sp.]|nr:hypothetical protein [Desulfobacteraceae bacterium]
MIKKIVLAVMLILAFSPPSFSETRNVSLLAENIREHLPDNAQSLYDRNTLYFTVGHYLAKHLTAATSTTRAHHLFDLYAKLVAEMRAHRGILPLSAVYYGMFEYMVIQDFLTRSGVQRIHHTPVSDRAYTGIEIYRGFEEFYAEKLRYESFLSLYAATHSDSFVYGGLITKYVAVFNGLMLNLHATMLTWAGLLDDVLYVKTNAPEYFPSDRITITLTADQMDNFTIDAIAITDGQRQQAQFNNFTYGGTHISLDTVVPQFSEYKIFAVLPVPAGANTLFDEAQVNIDIKNPFLITPDQIQFSPYLLDVYENHTLKGTKLLHPLDFIFTGGFPDDPSTEENEAEINLAIPGDFTHLIMYLGRLADGTPVGAEMTTSMEEKHFSIRLIKLLEKVDDPFDSSSHDLPLVTVNTKKYKHVNARRLNSDDLNTLFYHSHDIYQRVITDIYDSLDYQYQFYWSGNLDDKNIYLIDDGLAGGAACTDYWLALFEEIAGICIKEARMDRTGFIEYYTSDPVGTTVKIPGLLNPFPFEVYVASLLNSFGFAVIDPEPHIFSCDNSTETGIAIPDKLFGSADLVDIRFIH